MLGASFGKCSGSTRRLCADFTVTSDPPCWPTAELRERQNGAVVRRSSNRPQRGGEAAHGGDECAIGFHGS